MDIECFLKSMQKNKMCHERVWENSTPHYDKIEFYVTEGNRRVMFLHLYIMKGNEESRQLLTQTKEKFLKVEETEQKKVNEVEKNPKNEIIVEGICFSTNLWKDFIVFYLVIIFLSLIVYAIFRI